MFEDSDKVCLVRLKYVLLCPLPFRKTKPLSNPEEEKNISAAPSPYHHDSKTRRPPPVVIPKIKIPKPTSSFFCHGGPQFLCRELGIWCCIWGRRRQRGGAKFLKRSLGRQDIDLQRGTFNWMVFHSRKRTHSRLAQIVYLFPIFSLTLAGAATRSCRNIKEKKSETSFLYVRLSQCRQRHFWGVHCLTFLPPPLPIFLFLFLSNVELSLFCPGLPKTPPSPPIPRGHLLLLFVTTSSMEFPKFFKHFF